MIRLEGGNVSVNVGDHPSQVSIQCWLTMRICNCCTLRTSFHLFVIRFSCHPIGDCDALTYSVIFVTNLKIIKPPDLSIIKFGLGFVRSAHYQVPDVTDGGNDVSNWHVCLRFLMPPDDVEFFISPHMFLFYWYAQQLLFTSLITQPSVFLMLNFSCLPCSVVPFGILYRTGWQGNELLQYISQ